MTAAPDEAAKGEVICEREFLALNGGEGFPLLVQWMKPEPDQRRPNDQHTHWRCDYVIHWPGQPAHRRYAMGVDSTQALVLALSIVETELLTGPWPVRWFEDMKSLGLPLLEMPSLD
jgi:hypothetical protein